MINDTYPIWSSVNEVPVQFPWLDSDISCEVCVVGGGLTGALCALKLAESGAEVVLCTSGQIGYSATAYASPALQYDFGHSILSLKRIIGLEAAVRIMEVGVQSLQSLERTVCSLDGDCGFVRRDALLFTDDESELDILGREYLVRKHNGVDCSFVSRGAARDIFSLDMAGAIVSKDMAAQFDPYRLTHMCISRAVSLGARVFENTKITQLDSSGEVVVMDTSTRKSIFADKVVLSIGDEISSVLPVVSRSRTVFSVATEPVDSFDGWPGRCIIRSFSRPSVTVASTAENRIFCEGLGTSFIDEGGRLLGKIPLHSFANRRFAELENILRSYFPAISMPAFEFSKVTQYGETPDRLPVIGEHEYHDKCIFAICGGSSGALYSAFAADSAARIVRGESMEDGYLFAPMRFERKMSGGKSRRG
jgi:glycine/D-amino acid oxidase-like deaminating enzyme